MSEAEMDAHTIRNMRDQSVADGQPPKALVSLNPTDPLKAVIDKLFQNRCSMAPCPHLGCSWYARLPKRYTMQLLIFSIKLACTIVTVKRQPQAGYSEPHHVITPLNAKTESHGKSFFFRVICSNQVITLYDCRAQSSWRSQ